MKFYIHDIVRRLMELHGLEERLAALKSDPDGRMNAGALIESIRANLPVGVLVVHDKFRAKGKRSVAEVRNGVCAGCHLALGIGNVAAIRSIELRGCGNCGRYVYVVEEEASDKATSNKAKGKPSPRGANLIPASG
jgi:predicted  nucleic acid-binding Zn-ribbon protein